MVWFWMFKDNTLLGKCYPNAFNQTQFDITNDTQSMKLHIIYINDDTQSMKLYIIYINDDTQSMKLYIICINDDALCIIILILLNTHQSNIGFKPTP